MNTENQETEKEVNNTLPGETIAPETPTEVVSMANYYEANPNINKKNAVTIVMPNRKKFIEVHKIVEAAKETDPSFNAGKLFMQALDYCQSQGFYLVD